MRRTRASFALPFLFCAAACWGQNQAICSGEKRAAQCAQRIEELQRQIADLKAKLAEKSKASTLDQQEECASRAYEDFAEWGYKAKENSDFVSHYNAALDRCFIQTQNTIGKFFWRNLFDAYSGKQYGEYGWQEDDKKKYWDVPPFDCQVTLPSGKEQACHSDDEFKEVVKVYMGD